jgi:hypothetical protein
MRRLPDLRGLVGTWRSIFWWWQFAGNLQTMTSTMKHIASCENFRRTGKSTLPALPTLLEKGISDTEVKLLLETIDDILEEFDRPTRSFSHKNSFLKKFMQKVDDRTTQFLNERFIQWNCRRYASNFFHLLFSSFCWIKTFSLLLYQPGILYECSPLMRGHSYGHKPNQQRLNHLHQNIVSQPHFSNNTTNRTTVRTRKTTSPWSNFQTSF